MSYIEGVDATRLFSLRLPRDLRAPAAAREAAASFAACAPDGHAHDLRLIVSELVTNAVLHGDGATVELKLSAAGGVIGGEVIDDGEPFERRAELPADPMTTGGRGLAIVGTLTRSWGVREGSTHVWFELGAAPAR